MDISTSQAKVKCPKCGSDNVIIHTRGYSFFNGLQVGIALVIIYWAITIFSLEGHVDEVYVAGMLFKTLLIFLFSLLFGFVGKNKLKGRCLDCKKEFNI